MKKSTNIDVYLESINLHLKTNSTLKSGHRSVIKFKDSKYDRDSGGLNLRFHKNGSVQYQLTYCSNYTTFPVSLPTRREKFWTIQKRGHRIVVFCNGKLQDSDNYTSKVTITSRQFMLQFYSPGDIHYIN